MKNHGQGKNESLGCAHSTRPRIWGLGFVSSLLLCASGSPAVKWGHWSRSSRRCHLALVIYEDDASFLLRGYCTDKSSHRAWHRMKRHTCNQKLFHLLWKEPEKDKNKLKYIYLPEYSSIPILLLSVPLSSTESLSLPPLSHIYFLLVVVFLFPSLPYSRFPSFRSILSSLFSPFT